MIATLNSSLDELGVLIRAPLRLYKQTDSAVATLSLEKSLLFSRSKSIFAADSYCINCTKLASLWFPGIRKHPSLTSRAQCRK